MQPRSLPIFREWVSIKHNVTKDAAEAKPALRKMASNPDIPNFSSTSKRKGHSRRSKAFTTSILSITYSS